MNPTQERVYAAADQLLAEHGKRPSVALVREKARCSMADATRYTREWWADHQKAARTEQPTPDLPSPVADLAQRSTLAFWRAAVAAAREEHTAALAAARAEVDEAQEAADAVAAQVDETDAARAAAVTQLDELRATTTAQLETLAAERDRLAAALAEERAARRAAEDSAAKARADAAAANGLVSGLREALAAISSGRDTEDN